MRLLLNDGTHVGLIGVAAILVSASSVQAASSPVVRDHRGQPVVRDHRTAPVVRDHRQGNSGQPGTWTVNPGTIGPVNGEPVTPPPVHRPPFPGPIPTGPVKGEPGTPNPGTPNPGTPNPGTPNPGTPNPGTPNPGQSGGSNPPGQGPVWGGGRPQWPYQPGQVGVVEGSPYTSYRIDAAPVPANSALVRIINPATTRVMVSFMLGGQIIRLEPGQAGEFPLAGSDVVKFDRGGDFGVASYTIQEGTYRFSATPEGWNLYREPSPSQSSELPSNPLPAR